MPYVERIYKGEPTGERYYTPERKRKGLQKENTKKQPPGCGSCYRRTTTEK